MISLSKIRFTKNSQVLLKFITDGIDNPQIEKSILGDYLSDRLSPKVEVLINWNQRNNSSLLRPVY